MAILVDFEKVREDKREVEYIFGYPTMDRRLVIDKDSSAGRPLDGKEDVLYQRSFGTILQTYRDQEIWLEKGGYAA